MKAIAAALLLVLALEAQGAEPFTLAVHQSQSFQMMGATAAWAVDGTVVEATVQNGNVMLFGRAAGRTKIVVVSITGENTFDVIVQPAAGTPTAASASRTVNGGVAEVRYSSAAREIQNSVSATRETKNKRIEVAARTIHQTAADPIADRARTSIASASYRIFTRGRELTLFDRDVDHSPLTLSRIPIRGVHYLDDHWRIHGGVTAYAAHRSFLIPLERETVFGAAYSIRSSARSRVTPGLFVYPGKGSVASLLYDYVRSDAMSMRAELGVSSESAIGGAAQLFVDTDSDRARVDVRYRPRDFAVIGAGDARGLVADAMWSHAWQRGSSASLSFAATDLVETKQRVLGASADFDHRLTQRSSLIGGVSWGSFGDAESLTIPLGARVDFRHGGFTALYRHARSNTNSGGHGVRLAARASAGRFYASAFVDRQENAPTLELIFREQPELALALSELGINAVSPADVARALRENAALIELGFIEGVTVDLAPLRTQFGFEVAFLGSGAARHQLRARYLHNVVETVASSTETTIASLTYSRRITAATDVFAGYSYWRTDRRGMQGAIEQPFVEAGLRQRFDGLPSVFGGTGSISGVVFADEDLDGKSDGTGVAADVELDGVKITRTNADGTFVFKGVARGSHRVVARVPARPEAYFTTASRVEVEAGENVVFGVATTPARVQGRVVNDAGVGIAGVRLVLSRGASQASGVTDSEGAFSIVAAPGAWELSIVADSVPAGHSLRETLMRDVTLDRAQPLETSFVLGALRSVSGSGAPPNSDIQILPLGKTIRSDAEGRFSLRSLSPGELTLIAGSTTQRVTVPVGPASLSIDLGVVSASTSAPAPEIRTIVQGERRETMRGYVVQIGAFRVRANADDTESRARREGIDARIGESGGLWVVRAGPFSRREAATAAEKLHRAGIEAVVTSSN